MKRYLVFAGDIWYAGGGWRDLIGEFDAYEDAFAHATGFEKEETEVCSNGDTCFNGWWHIIDTHTSIPVLESDEAACGGTRNEKDFPYEPYEK